MSVKKRPEEYCSSSSLLGISGSPSCPRMSISATDHCLPFGSVTDWRSTYRQLSMLQEAIAIFLRVAVARASACGFWNLQGLNPHRLKPVPLRAEQLGKRPRNLRPGEWFGNQHDFFGVAGTQAFVRLLRRVTNDDNGKLGVARIAAHGIE